VISVDLEDLSDDGMHRGVEPPHHVEAVGDRPPALDLEGWRERTSDVRDDEHTP
jgi:hypothetical protein